MQYHLATLGEDGHPRGVVHEGAVVLDLSGASGGLHSARAAAAHPHRDAEPLVQRLPLRVPLHPRLLHYQQLAVPGNPQQLLLQAHTEAERIQCKVKSAHEVPALALHLVARRLDQHGAQQVLQLKQCVAEGLLVTCLHPSRALHECEHDGDVVAGRRLPPGRRDLRDGGGKGVVGSAPPQRPRHDLHQLVGTSQASVHTHPLLVHILAARHADEGMRIQRLLNYHVRPKVHGRKGCRLALPARGAGLQGAVPPRSVKCHLCCDVLNRLNLRQRLPRHNDLPTTRRI
mmetsp:Transcript_16399/g.29235  ORF Transcript_16399/g.29235 Transcript_16399/m.29235 type:complete len:287 (+) Transcript_16399:620-1480(+)